MYENGNGQFLETLLESKSIAEFLSNAEYIAQISEYDRNMLVEFQDIVTEVEDQKKDLEEENKKLEEMQTSLQEQQTEMESLIESKSEEISSLSSELGEVNEKIASLKAEAERQARMQQEAQAAASGSSGGTAVAAVQPLLLHRLTPEVAAADFRIRVHPHISAVSLEAGRHREVSEVRTIRDATMRQVREVRFTRRHLDR